MLNFLKQLLEDGEIVVPRQVQSDDECVRRVLIIAERTWRQEWSGPAPRFDVERAARAAAILCAFCRATVYRELDEQAIAAELIRVGLEPGDTASSHYSVDLMFRFLPQVYERLSRTSQDDPILAMLVQTARTWPLSSVGIAGSAPDSLPEAFKDRGLFRVYIDRVIALADQQRMNLPEVAAAVKTAVGPYDNLRANCEIVSPDPELG